jgi:hypothetical protein
MSSVEAGCSTPFPCRITYHKRTIALEVCRLIGARAQVGLLVMDGKGDHAAWN